MAVLAPDETVLGLLAARPQHGYELLDAFHASQALGRVWHLSTSQLYNVLKRLEREGFIDGRAIPSESGPPRTEYRLTMTGHAHLMLWLFHARPSSSIRRVRVEFLSRLYIASILRLPTAEIIRYQADACRRERHRLAALGSGPGMESLTTDFVIAQLDAVLAWLDRCAEALAHVRELDRAIEVDAL